MAERVDPGSQQCKHSVESEILVGSRTTWLIARIGDVCVLLITVFALLYFQMGARNWLIVFAIAAAIVTNSRRVVYGFMVEDGVLFKRYWKWIDVPWKEIDSISRAQFGSIDIHLRNSKLLNRRVSFIANPILFGKKNKHVGFNELKEAWLVAKNTETLKLSTNIYRAAE